METISINFDNNGMEISTDNREELSRVVDTVLQGLADGGQDVGIKKTRLPFMRWWMTRNKLAV